MDKQVFIVGGGPSLVDFDFSKLSGKDCIVINNSYKVLPEATICYFSDDDWWATHKEALLRHPGRKIKGSLEGKLIKHPGVTEYVLSVETGLDLLPGFLRHGNNSAYAAINLAAQMGYRVIYLLGIDLQWSGDGRSHWHKDHTRVDPPDVYVAMRNAF